MDRYQSDLAFREEIKTRNNIYYHNHKLWEKNDLNSQEIIYIMKTRPDTRPCKICKNIIPYQNWRPMCVDCYKKEKETLTKPKFIPDEEAVIGQ